LPRGPTLKAIRTVNRLLTKGGLLIVGLLIMGAPNELYITALLKGAFRIKRRYGAYDARPGNILRAAIGKPPHRPTPEAVRARTAVPPPSRGVRPPPIASTIVRDLRYGAFVRQSVRQNGRTAELGDHLRNEKTPLSRRSLPPYGGCPSIPSLFEHEDPGATRGCRTPLPCTPEASRCSHCPAEQG
jgi:hypothetical protein